MKTSARALWIGCTTAMLLGGTSALAQEACGTYVVVQGDNLRMIARKAYGDPDLYRVIFNANRDVIGDKADLILIGATLSLPCDAADASSTPKVTEEAPAEVTEDIALATEVEDPAAVPLSTEVVDPASVPLSTEVVDPAKEPVVIVPEIPVVDSSGEASAAEESAGELVEVAPEETEPAPAEDAVVVAEDPAVEVAETETVEIAEAAPAAEEPVAEEPVVEEPAPEVETAEAEPAEEVIVAEAPAEEETAAADAAVEAAVEEAVAEEATAEVAVTEEPVAEDPVTEVAEAAPVEEAPEEPAVEDTASAAVEAPAVTVISPMEGPIRIVTGNDYMPFADEMLPGGGMFTQIVEMAVFRADPDQAYSLTFINDWQAHVDALLPSGAYDLSFPWIRPACETPELLSAGDLARCNDFAFSAPYYEIVDGFFAAADSDLLLSTEYADFEGKRICRPEGYTTGVLESQGLGPDMVTLSRPMEASDCFEALEAGKVDLVSIDTAVGDAILTKMGLTDKFRQNPGLTNVLTLHVIAHKSNARAVAMLKMLDEGAMEMNQSGEWWDIVSSALDTQ